MPLAEEQASEMLKSPLKGDSLETRKLAPNPSWCQATQPKSQLPSTHPFPITAYPVIGVAGVKSQLSALNQSVNHTSACQPKYAYFNYPSSLKNLLLHFPSRFSPDRGYTATTKATHHRFDCVFLCL